MTARVGRRPTTVTGRYGARPGGPGRAHPTVLVMAGWAVLVTVAGAYALSRRGPGQAAASRAGTVLTGWDHLLGTVGDPYVVGYLLVLVAVAASWAQLRGEYLPQVLVRRGSHLVWLRASAVRAGSRAVVVVAGWVVVVAASGAGLPWPVAGASSWSVLAGSAGQADQVLGPLSTSGLSPATALAAQVLLLVAALVAAHVVLALALLATGREWAPGAGAAAIWLLVVVQLHDPPAAAVLDVPSWLLAHRATGGFDPVLLALAPSALVLAASAAGARVLDTRGRAWTRRAHGWVTRHWPVLVHTGLCALGLLAARAAPALGGNADVTGVLLVAYAGAWADGTSLAAYLQHAVVFLGAGYLFTRRLDDELGPRLHLVVLRAGSGRAWLFRLLAPALARAGLLLAALTGAATGLALLDGPGGTTAADLTGGQIPGPGWLLYQQLVNGLLQLAVIGLLVLVASWAAGGTSAGLGALAVLLVVGLPAVNGTRLLPAALSSLGYTTLGAGQVLTTTAVLGGWTVLLAAVALVQVTVPRYAYVERT